jgi:2-phosphoglycolate phosphatase
MTNSVIKAVLFDLDGTLLDSAPDLIATLNHLRAGVGLAALPGEDLRHFVSRGAIGMIRAGMPPCDDERLASWRDAFLEFYQENSFVESRPFDGVESTLEVLRQREIPWGVVTNKMEFLSVPLLKKMGWLSTLSGLVCGDTVVRSKPDPEPVLAACRQIGVKPEHALMVGDDLRDIEAGKRAGCQTAFALYGYSDKESRAELTDDTTVIDNPQGVLGILESAGAA